jgi:hypothetical protein
MSVFSALTFTIALTMSLLPEQLLIASALGYKPVTDEEGQGHADLSCCNLETKVKNGWPQVKYHGEWYPAPTLEEVEEWVFDSVCFTPDEEEVEPDHPDSWLSILGLI